jgi:hypothetical protein
MNFSRFQQTLFSVLVGFPLLALVTAPAKAQLPASFALSTNTTNVSDPAAGPASPNSTPGSPGGNVTALLGVLVMKGVLTPLEAKSIESAPPGGALQTLVDALTRKGVLSASDLTANTAVHSSPSAPAPAPVTAALAPPIAEGANPPARPVAPENQAPKPAAMPAAATPASAAVVPAIAPLRVLPVDPPVKDGLNAAFKMGPVKMTPYGFIKATAAYDSSSPNGDDFPFVGLFLSSTALTNTGPTKDPEFHLKARSTRIGANIEWPDASSRIVLTGRIEGDYEGNFSETDNRDVSSIRSSAFQLRLAWMRLDYNAGDKTDLYFEGGQDWTIFGSSVLPNILETTFMGAYYGNIWERSPQFQFGVVQKLSSWRNLKFSPTVAMMMPSSGEIEKLGSLGLEGQIAQAEREGADSGKPEMEARVAFQFQLDEAKGVAPAQILWSGFRARRTSIVTNSNSAVNECTTAGQTGCAPINVVNQYLAAFPNGFTTSSSMYGNQLGLQLPTRWFTLSASVYRGGDLRFFFGGQVDSYYTDTTGLRNPVMFTTVDGGPLAAAGGATLATNSAGQVVVAPQRPVRSFGGFVNIGLPLSRWFNADPKGHNSGWALYLDVGKDQVVHRDLINPGASAAANTLSPLPLLMGKMASATLYYKLNQWCQFAFEQSIYATRLAPGRHPTNGRTIAPNSGRFSRSRPSRRSRMGLTDSSRRTPGHWGDGPDSGPSSAACREGLFHEQA